MKAILKKLSAGFIAAIFTLTILAACGGAQDSESGVSSAAGNSSVKQNHSTAESDSIGHSRSASASSSADGGQDDVVYINSNIDYSESLDFILNPGQGFYYDIYTRPLSDDNAEALVLATYDESYDDLDHFDAATEIWDDDDWKDERQSLVHVKFGLENYSVNMGGADKPLGDDALTSVRKTLDNLRASGMTAILRFSYDTEGLTYESFDERTGTCDPCEPNSLDLVIEHVRQLATVVSDYPDCVYAVDAGMFGPWGEMHSSPFGIDTNTQSYYRLIEAWLYYLDEDIQILLRKPLLYLNWYNKKYATNFTCDNIDKLPKNEYDDRLGFFNDGFLTDDDDWGTYSNRARETAFLAEKNKLTVFGGEAVFVANSPYRQGAAAVKQLRQLKTAYLNYFYDSLLIKQNNRGDAWKQTAYGAGMNQADIEQSYVGQTYYKYIENRLGYRLVLRSSKLQQTTFSGGSLALKGTIENVGFGNITHKKSVYIVVKRDNYIKYIPTDVDVKAFRSGEKYEYFIKLDLPTDMTKGEYKAYMKISGAREQDERQTLRQIAFANPDVFDGAIGANYLGTFTVV